MTQSEWIDAPGPVRAGEELETTALARYLAETLPETGSGPLRIEQFGKGFSNLTYLLRLGDRELILRRPPSGVAIKSAHDMGREFRILSGLFPVYPKVPRPLAFCEDDTVIGTPFYLMERVRGVIFRREMPPEMIPDPDTMSSVANALLSTLAELHRVDYQAAGLGDLGRPAGYVRRQIEGWTGRYQASKIDPIPETTHVASWLRDSMPPESGASLIHNDFKYDNVVLDPKDWSSVIAILDWEMATLGDPLMDLGTSLAYWTQPGDPPALVDTRLGPTTLAGNPTRAEVVETYARLSGRDVSDIVFYYAYGLFKVAVIVQQLYGRYVSGKTSDPRFAHLIDGVHALSRVAWQAIQKNRIDHLF